MLGKKLLNQNSDIKNFVYKMLYLEKLLSKKCDVKNLRKVCTWKIIELQMSYKKF